MLVQVRLFAVASQMAGTRSIAVGLPENATVRDLRRVIAQDFPALSTLLPRMMIAVDAEYADDQHAIAEGSELAVIPPVSGGHDG